MKKYFDIDFQVKVVIDYKSGYSGRRVEIAKKYKVYEIAIWHWIVKD